MLYNVLIGTKWLIICSTRKKRFVPVWPDWAIYLTLRNFSKPVATINLPKFPTFLGKGVNIFNFSSEIIFGQLYRHLETFNWSHWFCPSLIVLFWTFFVNFTLRKFFEHSDWLLQFNQSEWLKIRIA